MHGYNGKKINVVVTSPPYNLGKKYNTYSDNLDHSEYLNWVKIWGGGIRHILHKRGSFFLNIGYTARNPNIPFDVLRVLSEYFELQNVIHWIKSISIPEADFTIGHFKPINTQRFVNQCHEYVFHFTKKGDVKLDKLSVGVPYADKTNLTRWNHKNSIRDRGNIWFIPYETKNGNMKHPCEFPIRLPEMCIKLHGITKNMIVYDPFMGIGSTAVACKKLNIECIGTEIDQEYIDVANNRLDEKELVYV